MRKKNRKDGKTWNRKEKRKRRHISENTAVHNMKAKNWNRVSDWLEPELHALCMCRSVYNEPVNEAVVSWQADKQREPQRVSGGTLFGEQQRTQDGLKGNGICEVEAKCWDVKKINLQENPSFLCFPFDYKQRLLVCILCACPRSFI